jgi:hypothetical protein
MKSLNQFIEEAANSVKKKEEEKIPKCPEGQYYDPKLKRCVIMPPKYGGRFWGGTFHKPNGNGHSNGNGNGSNGNGTPANGNGSNGHGNGGGNGSNG